MNRESSRSHLIMSIVIEATNLQTQNVTRGKLSFVDLAGSERCACYVCARGTCLRAYNYFMESIHVCLTFLYKRGMFIFISVFCNRIS